MGRILLISNGHGEDLSGALLAKKLYLRGYQVDSLALVGKGNAYVNQGIRNFGLKKEFSTGGIGYTSLKGRLTELFQGQLVYLIASLIRLVFISRNYDLLVVVGDVVPIFGAWLTRRPSVVYLVAYSSHYEGKLRLPWPCKELLFSGNFKEIYSRDTLTAQDLKSQLGREVLFLGNPFMDPIFSSQDPLPEFPFRLGILPGSRRPELDNNLLSILKVLLFLPEKKFNSSNVSIDIALVSSISRGQLEELIAEDGWFIEAINNQHNIIRIFKRGLQVNVHWDSFVRVVQSSNLLLAMAGTAVEQSIGIAKPVVQLPGRGPQFTSSFAEAQRRLLGPTVFCAEKKYNKNANIFQETANLISELYEKSQSDRSLKLECSKQALIRLGSKGGTDRIVSSIVDNCLINTSIL